MTGRNKTAVNQRWRSQSALDRSTVTPAGRSICGLSCMKGSYVSSIGNYRGIYQIRLGVSKRRRMSAFHNQSVVSTAAQSVTDSPITSDQSGDVSVAPRPQSVTKSISSAIGPSSSKADHQSSVITSVISRLSASVNHQWLPASLFIPQQPVLTMSRQPRNHALAQ